MKSSEILNSVSKSYLSNNLEKCNEYLNILLTDVIDEVKSSSRSDEIPEEWYDKLLKIVEEEIVLLNKSNLDDHASEHFLLLTSVFKCFRNSFFLSPLRQNFVAYDERRRCILVAGLNCLFDCFSKCLSITDREEKEQYLRDSIYACITCLINMMVGSSSIRHLLYPILKTNLSDLLSHPASQINQVSAALLHQFLVENDLRVELLTQYESIVPNLLEIYKNESPDACFALFCLNEFLSSSNILQMLWKEFSSDQSLLCLDILASFVNEKSNFKIIPSTLEFLLTLYKVMHRLLNLLCLAAAFSQYQEALQKDRSLLISTLYLLKSLTLETKSKAKDPMNADTKNFMNDLSPLEEEAPLNPVMGFRRDLIRLLACLVYKNKPNQDAVGELDGVSLLLENSQYDEENPLIRETCIFALRNLLEDNIENQNSVKNLELLGVADNHTLERIGMSADIQQGKIVLNQITK